eukprot:767614-Hanusia_phi.AAC.6
MSRLTRHERIGEVYVTHPEIPVSLKKKVGNLTPLGKTLHARKLAEIFQYKPRQCTHYHINLIEDDPLRALVKMFRINSSNFQLQWKLAKVGSLHKFLTPWPHDNQIDLRGYRLARAVPI